MTHFQKFCTNAALLDLFAGLASVPAYVFLPLPEGEGHAAFKPTARVLTTDKSELVRLLGAQTLLSQATTEAFAFTVPGQGSAYFQVYQRDDGFLPTQWADQLLTEPQLIALPAGGDIRVVPQTQHQAIQGYCSSLHTHCAPDEVPVAAWQALASHLSRMGTKPSQPSDQALPFQSQVAQVLGQMALGYGHSPVAVLQALLESDGPVQDGAQVGLVTPSMQMATELVRAWHDTGTAVVSVDSETAPSSLDRLVVHDLVGWSLQNVQGPTVELALTALLNGQTNWRPLLQVGVSQLLGLLKPGGRLIVDQVRTAHSDSLCWDYAALQQALAATNGVNVRSWAAWPTSETWLQWPLLADGVQADAVLNLGLRRVPPTTQQAAQWPMLLSNGQGLALAHAWLCVLEKAGVPVRVSQGVAAGQVLAYQWQHGTHQAISANSPMLALHAQTTQLAFFFVATRDGWTLARLAIPFERYLQAVQALVPQWPLRSWLQQAVAQTNPTPMLAPPANLTAQLCRAMPDCVGFGNDGKVFNQPNSDTCPVEPLFDVVVRDGQPLTPERWLLAALLVFLRGVPRWGRHEQGREFTRLQWAENLLAQVGLPFQNGDWERADIAAHTWQAEMELLVPKPAPQLVERDARILALEHALHYAQTDKNRAQEQLDQALSIAKGVTADVRRVITREVTADVRLRVTEEVSQQLSMAYESSLSWRVTRPLREAKNWLQRLRTGSFRKPVTIQPAREPLVPPSEAPFVQAVDGGVSQGDANGVATDRAMAGAPRHPIPTESPTQDAWLAAFVASHHRVAVIPSNDTLPDYLPRFDYGRWVSAFDHYDVFAQEAMRQQLKADGVSDVLGLVCLLGAAPSNGLASLLGDLLAQPYEHWHLVVLGYDALLLDPTCGQLMAGDKRLHYVTLPQGASLQDCLQVGVDAFPQEVAYATVLHPDTRLGFATLGAVAQGWRTHPEWEVVYGDVDVLNEKGQRCQPHFKPDWNEVLFYSSALAPQLHHSLTGGLLWARPRRWCTPLVTELTPDPSGLALAKLALMLRALSPSESGHAVAGSLREKQIGHIAKVLSHHPQALLQDSHRGIGLDLLHQYFQSKGESVALALTAQGASVQWPLPQASSLVSLIIPTRNNPHLLGQCVRSILAHTEDVDFEILLVDNGSDTPEAIGTLRELAAHPAVRVIRDNSAFNYSALNNHAVSCARGQWVALVNDDIEVLPGQGQWLAHLLRHAARPQVGVVGAKLLYPDGTVQHAGVFLAGTLSWHAYRHFPGDHPGHCGQALLARNSTCLTAACILVRKSIYQQVGGLDADQLTVGWNDTDFCLKVIAAGYQNVWTPDAVLVHHESATRGQDQTPEKKARAEREWRTMQRRWGDQMSWDPAYNVNLSLGYEDYSWAWPPRGENPSC